MLVKLTKFKALPSNYPVILSSLLEEEWATEYIRELYNSKL
jgi:hypothetical protein